MLALNGTVHVYMERMSGKGEDATAFALDEKDGCGYIAVCDGSGGAGAEIHPSLNNRKSAYLASRWTINRYQQLYESKKADFCNLPPEDIGEYLYEALCECNDKYPMNPTFGSILDILPTTFVSAIIEQTEQGDREVNFLWAGDSRGYIVDEDGLAQVTEDDVNSLDAYTNLTDDSVMTNRLHGNKNKQPFTIHKLAEPLLLSKKFIVFCASDGCYDYFNSPMMMETVVLTALASSISFAETEKQLLSILDRQAGDDCSISMAFYGFGGFKDIQEMAKTRLNVLQEKLNGEKLSAFNMDSEATAEFWETKYKENYYRYNPARKGTAI